MYKDIDLLLMILNNFNRVNITQFIIYKNCIT